MNVKVGDLAIMIKSARYPQHIGMIVEVVKFLGESDNLWGCHTSKPLMTRDKFTGEMGGSHKFAIPDANLRPVSGLDDPDSEVTDKPIEELTEA